MGDHHHEEEEKTRAFQEAAVTLLRDGRLIRCFTGQSLRCHDHSTVLLTSIVTSLFYFHWFDKFDM